MNTTLTVKNTVYFSIIIQIISTVITWEGLFKNLKSSDVVLKEILAIENIVQIIEFTFYLYIASYNTDVSKIGTLRYVDWFVTTPTMLFTTIVYMEYNNVKNGGEILDVKKFISLNKIKMYKIFVNNFFMLVCGLLVEMNIINMYLGISLGFYFFYQTFKIIHTYTKNNVINDRLYAFLVIVWGLYGFAAMLSNKNKNISYNLLDLVAKNFYGLYIYFLIKSLS
jgi:bacteriorhodopsin